MKNFLHNSLRALFLSLMVLLSLPMLAEKVKINGINYDLNTETKEASVIKWSNAKYSGDIIIPELVTYNGKTYSVTSIGDGSFSVCYHLTSVVIPNSVTIIGTSAFSDCYALISVTIPNSVTSIGERAFEACRGLTSVHISDIPAWFNIKFANNTSNPLFYAEHLFLNGEEITNLAIPNGVTSIGNYQFQNCSAFTSVTIPNSVRSIGQEAFSGCSGLTSVTIPNSVKSIERGAFSDCSGLNSVYISDIAAWCNIDFRDETSHPLYTTTQTISSMGCIYLNGEVINDLKIPNNVESINDYAFYGCLNLNSVNIPKSVTSIGASAFYKCLGLATVSIPNSITSIGNQAFYGCTSLQRVTIPNSVTSLGNSAFCGCTNLSKVSLGNKIGSIGEYTFSRSAITKIVIPNSVRNIGKYAFHECNSLRAIYIKSNYPPSIVKYTFSLDQNNYITLYIPYGTKSKYNTGFWYEFRKFVQYDPNTLNWEVVDAGGDLVIRDGESFENTEERELGILTYTRTLPNRYWNPLYVPFKIPYEALKDNYDVAYINSMHSYDNDQDGEIEKMTMEVIKIKKGVLKANHPYLIRAKNEAAKQMDLLLEDVTLYPTVSNKLDCSSVYTHFEITGTYKKMTREDLGGSLVITTDGAWKKLAASSILKPFRFYLTITDREGSPLEVSEDAKSRINICVQGEDDFATGIDEVKLENANVKTAVYDISGRRVQKAQKGIYIQNGKLTVK